MAIDEMSPVPWAKRCGELGNLDEGRRTEPHVLGASVELYYMNASLEELFERTTPI